MVEDGPRCPPSEPRTDEAALTARFVQLIAGLVLFGVSLALLVRSELGLDPWDVFHQGLSVATGLSIGVCTIAAGVAVLPARESHCVSARVSGPSPMSCWLGSRSTPSCSSNPPTADLGLRWADPVRQASS